MKEKHKIDPLDKLIAEVQGADVRDPIPEPDGAAPAESFTEAPRFHFNSAAPDRVQLWYKKIYHIPDEGNKYSDWHTHALVISALLSVLSPKERENKIIELALQADIGRYPKILYAFEWFDARMDKAFRQEIPGGFVRG